MAHGNFGFFDNIDFNISNVYYSASISLDYANLNVTSMFPFAKNHCAAVTSTNIDKIYTGLSDFDDHYSLIGNGPVLTFAKKTKSIMSDKGYVIESQTKFIEKIDFIFTSIDFGNICTLLLFDNITNWHWVICTGYIEFIDGSIVLEIFDNWNRRKRYYRPDKGSKIICATSYFEA